MKKFLSKIWSVINSPIAYMKGVLVVFIVFAYEDERWVSGVRKNAYATSRDRSCAIVFPSAKVALAFADVLTATYGGVFSVFSFDEVM